MPRPLKPKDLVAPTPAPLALYQSQPTQFIPRQDTGDENYPSCIFVDPAVITCYPTKDTVAYQNQYTRVIWNTQYTLFFTDDGDGLVDLYLRIADSDEQRGKWNATRRSGVLKLPVDNQWFDSRAVSLWQGQPRNWTFYWVIVPAGKVLDGGEQRQPTFTVVQTALPTSTLVSSTSVSSNSESLSSAEATSSLKALQDPQSQEGGSNFPPWAIALVVVLGVVTLASILSLVFVLQRYLRRKQRQADRRNSMGSESPMMAAADPSSPLTHESSYAGHASVHASALPPAVRPAPSIQQESVHSSKDPMISTNEAAYMADAFRKALRRPDFTDRPQEEGESPETRTEKELLQSELAGEGRDIRSVSSERGVMVVKEDEEDKAV